MVFVVRHKQVLLHFPFAISSKCCSLSLLPFATDKQHCAWPRLHLLPSFLRQIKSARCCSVLANPSFGRGCRNNLELGQCSFGCQSTFNFDDFLVLSDINLISYQMQIISPSKNLQTKIVFSVVIFSYQTNRESPAGDQFSS